MFFSVICHLFLFAPNLHFHLQEIAHLADFRLDDVSQSCKAKKLLNL